VAKYLVLYRSTMTADELMSQNNPEQAQAGMDAWMAWAQQAGDAIVDLGAPLRVVETGGDSGDPVGGHGKELQRLDGATHRGVWVTSEQHAAMQSRGEGDHHRRR
jgi:hypothetical protein